MFGFATSSKQDLILQQQQQIMDSLTRLATAVGVLKTLSDTAGIQLTALRQEVLNTEPAVLQAATAVEAVNAALQSVTQTA